MGDRVKITEAEWNARGVALFGADVLEWKFVCPSCGHVARVRDWQSAGAPENTVAFSCVGRWLPDPGKLDANTFKQAGGPCAYAGGGLIGLNPVTVLREGGRQTDVFAFAEPP